MSVFDHLDDAIDEVRDGHLAKVYVLLKEELKLTAKEQLFIVGKYLEIIKMEKVVNANTLWKVFEEQEQCEVLKKLAVVLLEECKLPPGAAQVPVVEDYFEAMREVSSIPDLVDSTSDVGAAFEEFEASTLGIAGGDEEMEDLMSLLLKTLEEKGLSAALMERSDGGSLLESSLKGTEVACREMGILESLEFLFRRGFDLSAEEQSVLVFRYLQIIGSGQIKTRENLRRVLDQEEGGDIFLGVESLLADGQALFIHEQWEPLNQYLLMLRRETKIKDTSYDYTHRVEGAVEGLVKFARTIGGEVGDESDFHKEKRGKDGIPRKHESTVH